MSSSPNIVNIGKYRLVGGGIPSGAHDKFSSLYGPKRKLSLKADEFFRTPWSESRVVSPELKGVLRDVMRTEPFKRLSGVLQMYAFYTVRGEKMDHSRRDHSLEALDLGCRIAEVHRLSKKQTALLCFATLLHDIGHPPFGHTGDDTLKKVTVDYPRLGIPKDHLGGHTSFDHDVYGLDLISKGEIASVINQSRYLSRSDVNVHVRDVVCVLADTLHDALIPNPDKKPAIEHENKRRTELFNEYRYLHYLTKEVADPCAYLRADLGRLHFDLSKSIDSLRMQEQIIQAIRIGYRADGRDNYLHVGFDEFAFIDEEGEAGALLKMIAYRDQSFQEAANHTASITASAIIRAGIIDALRRGPDNGGFSLPQYLRMTDAEAIRYFDEIAQDRLLGKIENAFTAVGGWTLSQMTGAGRAMAVSGALAEKIKKSLPDVLPADGVVMALVPDYSKQRKVARYSRETGKIHDLPENEGKIGTSVTDHRRIFFVAIDKKLPSSVVEEARHSLFTLMHEMKDGEGVSLLDGIQFPLVENLYGDLDPALFPRSERVIA